MNSILQAIEEGYSEDEILKYISKAIPKLVPKINKAISSGYGIKEVLGFLSKSSPQDTRGMSESQIHRRNRDLDSELAKKGLATAATIAGTGLSMGMAKNALSRALPRSLQGAEVSSLQNNIPSMLNGSNPLQSASAPTSQTPQAPNQLLNASQQPPVNQVSPNLPQPAQPQQPKVNFGEFLTKHNAKDKVDDLIKSGNGAEIVGGYLKKFHPQLVKDMEKEAGDTIENVIGRYAEENQATPQEQPSVEPEGKKLDVSKETPEVKTETKPISKNETVASPQGIGEVKEIRGDKALVEVDGKLHKVDVEDLEQSPLPEKDLAELYDELLRGIESETGEDVSRMVQWAGYNPTTNTLQFLPHTGKLYTYKDISEEDAALLRDILSVRKTSGENFIGAWKKDSKSPIGAALSKLIRKLQSERGGKGNEYEASYEPIYSAYEPAIQAEKRKKKK